MRGQTIFLCVRRVTHQFKSRSEERLVLECLWSLLEEPSAWARRMLTSSKSTMSTRLSDNLRGGSVT